MKTTIIGGVIFLIPLAFIVIILQKVYEIAMLVAGPLDGVLPLDRVAGIALVNILAILVILLLCYCAGLVARSGLFSKRMEKVENVLIGTVPGYAAVRGVVAGVTSDEVGASMLKPVLVRFDDYDQIAFRIEEFGDKCTIFLPGAPAAGSGTSVIVARSRVTPLDLPPHRVITLLRKVGRGSLTELSKLNQST